MRRFTSVTTLLILSSMNSAMAQSGFYVGVTGSALFPFDQEADTDVNDNGVILQNAGNVDFEYDTGYQFGGHIGYKVDTNIRVQGELSYASAEADRVFSFVDVQATTKQDLSIFAGNAGIFFDLWPISTIVPYIGGGLGYAQVAIDNDQFGDADQNVFTAFAEGGIPIAITPEFSIAPTARFTWYRTEEEEASGVPVIAANLYTFQAGLTAQIAF